MLRIFPKKIYELIQNFNRIYITNNDVNLAQYTSDSSLSVAAWPGDHHSPIEEESGVQFEYLVHKLTTFVQPVVAELFF